MSKTQCKKLKVVLTLLWLFELQLEYTIAIAIHQISLSLTKE